MNLVKLSRRDFWKYTAVSMLLGYLPSLNYTASAEELQTYQFYNSYVGSKISIKMNGGKYFCELRVSEKSQGSTTLYLHQSDGFIKDGKLFPEKSFIKRNFYYLWLMKARRDDDFELNFTYKNGRLIEVRGRDSYGNSPNVPYNSHSADILTAIAQILLDFKVGKRQKEMRQLTDKRGSPVLADTEISSDNAVVNVKSQPFDFEKMVINFKNFEPLEIIINGLYSVMPEVILRK